MVAGFCITVQYYYYLHSFTVVVVFSKINSSSSTITISRPRSRQKFYILVFTCNLTKFFYSFYFCYTGALTDRECVLNSTKRVLKCN